MRWLFVAYDIVRYVGAAYLLYLAWKAFISNTKSEDTMHFKRQDQSAMIMFRQGLLTNLLSPKMAIFVLALFPQFISPQSGSVAVEIMVLATVLNFVGILINGAVIIAVGRISSTLASNCRIKNISQYFLGTVFAGLAAKLAFDIQR